MKRIIKLDNGNKVLIQYDEHGESPREWDNLGTMVCFHNRYNLGDTHKHSIKSEDYESFAEMIEANTEEGDIVLPLFLYDHGGLSISTGAYSCSWDSGQIGYITVSKETIIKEYGNDTPEQREKVEGYLKGEVNTYDQFLRGEVYTYTVQNEDGEIIDGCGGFYGSDHETSGLLDYARGA